MLKNKFSPRFIPLVWVLFILLLLSLILRLGLINLDPDLPWHLKFGQDILSSRQLPNDQIHLWTIPGGTWVDHEWLTNVLMYQIFHNYGYKTLNFIFSLLVLSALLLVVRYLKTKNPRVDFFVMLLLLLGYFALLPHLGPRPQVISLLFLALEFLILNQSQNWHRFKIILLLGGLFWLWACLHAGFLIGLLVLALWSSEQLITGWRQQNPKQFWLGLQAGCLSFVVTLVTPYGLKLYDFLSTYSNNAYLTHINEWKAFYVFPVNYWQLLFTAITIALSIILFTFGDKKRHLQPWQWLNLFIFLMLSLKSVRHWPLFFIVSCFTFWPIFLQTPAAQEPNFILPKWASLTLKTFLIIGLIFLNIFSWWSLPRVDDPWQSFCQDYPCQTARQLKNHPVYSQLKLFNQYSYGGWLIWLWPEKQLFIDGRLPQYSFAGWSLLEEYLEFSNPKVLKNKLKEYKIEAVLWNNQMPQYKLNRLDKFLGFNERAINNNPNNLKLFLDSSPDWQAVFADKASTVYVRKDKLEKNRK